MRNFCAARSHFPQKWGKNHNFSCQIFSIQKNHLLRPRFLRYPGSENTIFPYRYFWYTNLQFFAWISWKMGSVNGIFLHRPSRSNHYGRRSPHTRTKWWGRRPSSIHSRWIPISFSMVSPTFPPRDSIEYRMVSGKRQGFPSGLVQPFRHLLQEPAERLMLPGKSFSMAKSSSVSFCFSTGSTRSRMETSSVG